MDVEIEAQEGGFRLYPLQTPKGTPVVVPTQALADAVAAEWKPVKRAPRMNEIPFTQYINTAIDLTSQDPERTIAELLSYLPTDVLVMWHSDPALIAEQKLLWKPQLDWAASIGITLEPNYRLQPQDVSAESEAAYRKAIEGLDVFQLTALSMASGLFGSAILALRVINGSLTSADALNAAWLEENYQIARWKLTEEQAEKRDAVQAEIDLLDRFLTLLAKDKNDVAA